MATVRVDELELLPVRLPLRSPVTMAGERLTVAETVVVRVAGDGVTGWGESTSAAQTTGETPDRILAALEALRADRFRPGMGSAALAADGLLARSPAARSALDMAISDLEARAAGIPLWAALGGTVAPSPVPVSVILAASTPDDDVAAALAHAAAGIRIVKLKVGRRDPGEEGRLCVRLRESLPAEVRIGADANAGMTREAAAAFCAAAALAGLAFLEQPLDRHDVDGLARLRRVTAIPIVADEAVGTAADVDRLHAAQAIDGVMIKVQKAGSLRDALDAALAATAKGLGVGLTGKVAETSVAGAALLHLAGPVGEPAYGISLTAPYLADDPVDGALSPVAGAVRVPAGPGLGVTPDETRLRASLVSGFGVAGSAS